VSKDDAIRSVEAWDTPDKDPRVENAARAIAKATNIPWNFASAQDCRIAARAALPHLLPVPSQSDEAHNFEMEIATVENEDGSVNGDDVRRLLSHAYACGASCVRAEATLAEKERCAKWHDDRARQTPDAFEMEFHQVSAAAIRAGLTADDWLAAAIRGKP